MLVTEPLIGHILFLSLQGWWLQQARVLEEVEGHTIDVVEIAIGIVQLLTSVLLRWDTHTTEAADWCMYILRLQYYH